MLSIKPQGGVFELPALPYPKTALAPHISSETLDFHHGKHHNTYVTNLNGLIKGTPNEGKSCEDILKGAEGGLFNNAAQVWNHAFYWHSMSPDSSKPSAELGAAIDAEFGSMDDFIKKFSAAAAGQFGSGWAWLVKKGGKLAITTTSNAGCPLTTADETPLMTCDVWEHAYYVDYRNARPAYLEAWWKLANWNFASENFKG